MNTHDIELQKPFMTVYDDVDKVEVGCYSEIQVRAAIEADRKHFAELFMDLSRYAAGMYEQECDSYFNGLSDGYRYAADFLIGKRNAVDDPKTDRQANKTLENYMPEVVAALKATGCNESLVADIEKSMRGEGGRQANEPRTDADRAAVWLASELAAIIPTKDLLKATKSSGAMVAYFKRLIGERQARGEPVAALIREQQPLGKDFQKVLDDSRQELYIESAPHPHQQAGESCKPASERIIGEIKIDAHRHPYARLNTGYDENGNQWKDGTPFYAAPQPPQIPEGYKLVPNEPTEEMLKAAQTAWLNDPARRTTTIYRAMLEAAPEVKE